MKEKMGAGIADRPVTKMALLYSINLQQCREERDRCSVIFTLAIIDDQACVANYHLAMLTRRIQGAQPAVLDRVAPTLSSLIWWPHGRFPQPFSHSPNPICSSKADMPAFDD